MISYISDYYHPQLCMILDSATRATSKHRVTMEITRLARKLARWSDNNNWLIQVRGPGFPFNDLCRQETQQLREIEAFTLDLAAAIEGAKTEKEFLNITQQTRQEIYNGRQ